MVKHVKHHKVPSNVHLPQIAENGFGQDTESILEGIAKSRITAPLAESVIVWRAQHIAWNVGLDEAERLLSRLVDQEGSQNPQALDLLARISFQKKKYDRAMGLWKTAAMLQPANPTLRKTSKRMQEMAKAPSSALRWHKTGVWIQLALFLGLLCVCIWGGIKGHAFWEKTAQDSAAKSEFDQNAVNLSHYGYRSVTNNMELPADEPLPAKAQPKEQERVYGMTFTRKKISSGRDMGQINITVKQTGSRLKVAGAIPDLNTRYLVEQALWEVPGVTAVDLRDVEIANTYQVVKGDTLEVIGEKLYGDGTAWKMLAALNKMENPRSLRIGQKIRIPLGDEVLELVTGH